VVAHIPVNNNPGNPVRETAIVVWRPPRDILVTRIPVVVRAIYRPRQQLPMLARPRQQLPMLAVNNPAVTETAIVPWSPSRFSWRDPVATMAVAEPARVVQGPEPAPIVQGPPRGPSIAHIVHGYFSDFIDREVHNLAAASNNRAIVVWHPPLLDQVRQVAAPSGTSVEPDIPPALNDAEEVAPPSGTPVEPDIPPVPPAIKPASRNKPRKFKTHSERHPVAQLDDGFDDDDDDGFGVFGDDDEEDEYFPPQSEEVDAPKPEEEARPSKKMRKHPPTYEVNDPAEPEEARPSKKMRKHPPTYKVDDPAELDSASECKLDSLSNSTESDSAYDPAKDKDNRDDEEEEEDIDEEAIDEDSEAIDEDYEDSEAIDEDSDDDSNRNGNGKVMVKRKGKGKIYKATVRTAKGKGKGKAKRKAHRKPKRKAGTPPTIAEEQLDNLVREKVCAPSVLLMCYIYFSYTNSFMLCTVPGCGKPIANTYAYVHALHQSQLLREACQANEGAKGPDHE